MFDEGEGGVVAYFSMEIGLKAEIPTYSGGLGVLAGDTIRSAADLRIPMVGVTLLHRKGYFHQTVDSAGQQSETPENWAVESFLEETNKRVTVVLEGRTVYLRAWKYECVGVSGFKVPVYFLDSDLKENSEWDRTLTHYLYGGDLKYRFCQEAVLGIGGVRMLRALGFRNIRRFHMNEGHSSLLTLELLEERLASRRRNSLSQEDIDSVRKLCVFTTHTPVPAGHDQFQLDLVKQVIPVSAALTIKEVMSLDHVLNMTHLALNLSQYVNGVAKTHGEVSRQMFPNYVVDAITNGVHAASWVSKQLQGLFDRYIPAWREDNWSLRYAVNLPKQEVWAAHLEAKRELFRRVYDETKVQMDENILTLGFARRATAYKRPELLFQDIDKLKKIVADTGAIQVIYAGKAHPSDVNGKELIRKIVAAGGALSGHIKMVYLANYNMELGKQITAGVDVWLNTPQPPLEASGTSGMKAALNGVPSLSVLDGWWMEGCIEGVTGWAIGEKENLGKEDRTKDYEPLYSKLEKQVIPTFYKERDRFINIMLHAIALNGSFFNTERMMQQYVVKAYFR